MKPVWEIDGGDLETLQGDSPGFVRFLNTLLAAQAQAGGLPDSAVSLNQKDAEGDGGVDAVLSQAILASLDPTGRFSVPTCWQFKASPTRNLKPKGKGGQPEALIQEINKPHARRLVEQGYGYRLCVATDMPDQKKSEWEGLLFTAARKIKGDASAPSVLTASDLAIWANRFKGLVVRHFRSELRAFQDLESWRGEVARFTQDFVPIRKWEESVQAIREHVDFSRPAATLLTVGGVAGVGKTRCTCEALLEQPSHQALVVYTNDEKAAYEFALVIARDSRLRAILVADECGLESRVGLGRILPGCADRLRIIAIDNSLQRSGGAGEVSLTQLDVAEVDQILSRNFPSLPPDRRLSYARLAQGFVRLAVDLCQHDAQVPPDGSIESVFGFFHDHYLRTRLSDKEFEAVLLVALLPRVGYRDDVAWQLEKLCAHVAGGPRPSDVTEVAQRLRHSPGFLVFGGRFLYVTPILIAQVAFQSAWERWVETNPAPFLREFPSELIDAFVERVKSSGTQEMRKFAADFFLHWATDLDSEDLGREPSVSRLVRLVELQPETLAPVLQDLLERTSLEDLRRLHSGLDGHQARRQFVWLAQNLAQFEEFFTYAEAMLFRLALAETETQLGNNASWLWTALFRIDHSGTAASFADRLQLLEQRLRGADDQQLTLGLAALKEILADGPVFIREAPPVVFGRTTPPQWRPANPDEYASFHGLALALAVRLAKEGGSVSEVIRSAVVKSLAPLLLRGRLDEIKVVLGDGPWPDAVLAAVVRGIEQFLDVFCKDHRDPVQRQSNGAAASAYGAHFAGPAMGRLPRLAEPDLEARVREWYRGLAPADLHGRLISLVGQDPWHHQLHGDQDGWWRELENLASELLRSPSSLEHELGWLCSSEARSAFHLGRAIGDADERGGLLDQMLGDIPLAGGAPLARGYLERISTSHPRHLARANSLLDRLQETHPRVAYDVLWSAGDEVRKVSRFLQMVGSGGLPADFLRGLAIGVRDRPLAIDELLQALDKLIEAAKAGNGRAAQAAVYLVHRRLHPSRDASGVEALRRDPRLLETLPAALELALDSAGREPNSWVQLVDDLAEVEIGRAVDLAVRALGSEDYNTRLLAEESLVRMAGSHPDEVMRGVGATILSPSRGLRYSTDRFSRLFAALPLEVVKRWLGDVGVKGALGLARHLEPPRLDDEDRPDLPPLTAFVLKRFDDDDQVFREFRDGVHAGQGYSGDIAGQHEREVAVARKFLRHPLRRIREWARFEVDSAKWLATSWRQRDEEEEMVGR